MITRPVQVLSALAVCTLALPDIASAQCLDWKSGFGVRGIQGQVLAFESFDDGTGTGLYAGGLFTHVGSDAVASIARWDGSAWAPLGSGITGASESIVFALQAFDDGTGPALYVGGYFGTAGGVSAGPVARWDGAAWSAIGTMQVGQMVLDLEVFDDGSGAALYAGTRQGAGTYKWNGSSWTPLPGGPLRVMALCVFNDGTGRALYAAGDDGSFTRARVMKWDGSGWSNVGSGYGSDDSTATDLAVFDAGHDVALYVGGNFTSLGGQAANRIAKWDGTNWSALGSGATGAAYDYVPYDTPYVSALCVFDDGGKSTLLAGGHFTHAGDRRARSLARWNGSQWSAVGGGVDPWIGALAMFDDGSGRALFAGGSIEVAGDVAASAIAKWNGAAWSAVVSGPAQAGVGQPILAFANFDDGMGSALYAGGAFHAAGAIAADYVARFDGQTWSALGGGVNDRVAALAVHDDGSGPALFAGGEFSTAGNTSADHVAKWDGSSWTALGAGLESTVRSLAVYDDGSGSRLYAGCWTEGGGGGSATRAIARWDGSTWSALGSGIDHSASSPVVNCLAVFDSGAGPELYAGGAFDIAGGNPVNNVARWNGSSWAPLGTGVNGTVDAMTVFDDGTGPALYVGGFFDTAGTLGVNNVAKWDGSTWSTIDQGLNGWVASLIVVDDGRGPSLVAGGQFGFPAGFEYRGLARWGGSRWTIVSDGVAGANSYVLALGSVPQPGGGSDLCVGGSFESVGGVPSKNFAVWRGCGGPATLFCSGEAPLSPCPCSNAGGTGRGCANSQYESGSLLVAAGSTNPDSVVLTASAETANALSVFVQGTASVAPVPFGDGIRCASGTLKRLYSYGASDGSVSAPAPGDPSITVRSAALGDPIAPGTTRTYQTVYRDSASYGCAGDFNATNALRIAW